MAPDGCGEGPAVAGAARGGGPMTRGRAGVHRRLRVGACLSLSGECARFGTQAARGLEAWQSLDGAAELIIADDRSDPGTLVRWSAQGPSLIEPGTAPAA